MFDFTDWNKTRLGLSLLHGLPRRVSEQQKPSDSNQVEQDCNRRQGSSGSQGDHRIRQRIISKSGQTSVLN